MEGVLSLAWMFNRGFGRKVWEVFGLKIVEVNIGDFFV